MRSLTDALPCQKRGAYLSTRIKEKLIGSLNYLLEFNKNTLREDYYKGKNIVEKISSLKNPPSIYYALNSFLLQATCSGEINSMGLYISALSSLPLEISIGYSSFSENSADKYKNELLRKYMLFDLTEKTNIFEPTLEAANVAEKLVKETLTLIKKHAGSFYQEMLEFISEFMFFKANGIKAGSSFDLFGLIYINASNLNPSWINMADIIIHEAAHLYLYAVCIEDPLVLNEYEEEHFSPIKGRERPLVAIYHAMFVLARVIYFLRQLKELNCLTIKEHQEVEHLLAQYHAIALESLSTVSMHAKLTTLGRDLLQSSADILQTEQALA